MGAEGVDRQQQRINEFLRLLPLRWPSLACHTREQGKHYNEGQLEVRGTTLRWPTRLHGKSFSK